MKYLRLFDNDAEYQSFLGGEYYVEPHIVGIKNNTNKPSLNFKEKK